MESPTLFPPQATIRGPDGTVAVVYLHELLLSARAYVRELTLPQLEVLRNQVNREYLKRTITAGRAASATRAPVIDLPQD